MSLEGCIARPHSPEDTRERRRRQILRAARVEFAAKGYYKTGVASIADRAGVSKGTIYNYFDDKEALLMGVISTGFDQIARRMQEISAEITDPIQKISSALFAFLEFFARNRAFFKVLIKEEFHILPKASQECRDYYVAHVDQIEKLIRQGIASKRLAKVDAGLAALCFMEMVGAVTKGAILMNRKLDVCTDHETIMRIFLNGIEKK